MGQQHDSILTLLGITPSSESLDYVQNKKQFQLQNLLTEQRHSKTYNLSDQISMNTTQGLNSLLSVDEDISKKFNTMSQTSIKILENASLAIQKALLKGNKVYLYGTGATGRLAEQIEATLWRPFWERLKGTSLGNKIKKHLPELENRVIGEITGGDRALVSSLEGFEDLQLIGELQLKSHHIKKGDVIFAVTEGGETSAVIGTILAAAQQYKDKHQAKKNLFFIYNNPDKVLLPFYRSRSVLKNPAITKINLTTGPQAISGSTRMQATTSEFFLLGILFEDALYHLLKPYLSQCELRKLGFTKPPLFKKRLQSFQTIQKTIANMAIKIVPWTELEAKTYATHQHAIYLAQQAILQVFTDVTERAPTFSLAPLDTLQSKERNSWIQIWTPAKNLEIAWRSLLHRPFRGLSSKFYEKHFKKEITDHYLRTIALRSLKQAGPDQQYLYDFSFSKKNLDKSPPHKGDLGVLILLSDEKITDPVFLSWLTLFTQVKANIVTLLISTKPIDKKQIQNIKQINPNIDIINITLPESSPLRLNQQVGLKMLLNAHSTAVMTKMGRVVGNTMTYVRPSNLKLIGRSTYLIKMHVNNLLKNSNWIKHHGQHRLITYSEANAVLFDALHYTKGKADATASEVTLSIIRILETLKTNHLVSWEKTNKILNKQSLLSYLSDCSQG